MFRNINISRNKLSTEKNSKKLSKAFNFKNFSKAFHSNKNQIPTQKVS
jgi:pterin-4a-carbinolamine dehydratase